MSNKYVYSVLAVLAACLFVFPAEAARSKLKGDPNILWLSPLGDGNIKNDAYNRCRLIRTVKPGVNKAAETARNTYDIMSDSIANLYAQSIKISEYIAAENDKDDEVPQPDMSNEKALIEQGIIQKMSDISRRLNIINSLEAGIAMLDALSNLQDLPPTAYEEFRVLQNGKYVYSDDCKDLKR